jgi:ADP-heptose:LPS heptosyltransferase
MLKNGLVTLRGIPGKSINFISNKEKNKQIRLDKLLESEKPKILIKRRLGGIGDVIMSTPLLKKIKRLLPHCELTYATDLRYLNGSLSIVIEHNPYVDLLVQCGTVEDKDYDYCCDITTTGLQREKSGSIPPNRIDMFAEEAGVSVENDPVPDYIVTETEKEEAVLFLKDLLHGKEKSVIGLQSRSNDARRTWPLENVQRLAELLSEKGHQVLLFDWGKDTDRWKEKEGIRLIKDLPFDKVAALVNECDLIVCPDSSMLHLAGALDKKTVSIFGPIPPQSRINHYANTDAIQLNLHCKNCWYSASKCNGVRGTKLYCLTGITPEMVVDAVEKKLKEPLKQTPFTINKETNEKILVKRNTGGLGDILMITPTLKALKERFPKKHIQVAIPKQYFRLMENLEFVDEVIDITKVDLNKEYFINADLSSPCARYESSRVYKKLPVEKSRIEVFAEVLGVRNLITHTPVYNVTEKEREWAIRFLKGQDIDPKKPIVCFHLRSNEKYRDYPVDSQLELLGLIKNDYNIICIDFAFHESFDTIIDATGFSIDKWAAIISLSDLFISVDTGPLHMAAALDITTIALFGPIDYKARCKGYKKTTVIISDLPCIPCWRNATIKCKQTNLIDCYSKCLESIKPKQIAKIIKGILKNDTRGI